VPLLDACNPHSHACSTLRSSGLCEGPDSQEQSPRRMEVGGGSRNVAREAGARGATPLKMRGRRLTRSQGRKAVPLLTPETRWRLQGRFPIAATATAMKSCADAPPVDVRIVGDVRGSREQAGLLHSAPARLGRSVALAPPSRALRCGSVGGPSADPFRVGLRSGAVFKLNQPG